LTQVNNDGQGAQGCTGGDLTAPELESSGIGVSGWTEFGLCLSRNLITRAAPNESTIANRIQASIPNPITAVVLINASRDGLERRYRHLAEPLLVNSPHVPWSAQPPSTHRGRVLTADNETGMIVCPSRYILDLIARTVTPPAPNATDRAH
jgi:hypothetical protein